MPTGAARKKAAPAVFAFLQLDRALAHLGFQGLVGLFQGRCGTAVFHLQGHEIGRVGDEGRVRRKGFHVFDVHQQGPVAPSWRLQGESAAAGDGFQRAIAGASAEDRSIPLCQGGAGRMKQPAVMLRTVQVSFDAQIAAGNPRDPNEALDHPLRQALRIRGLGNRAMQQQDGAEDGGLGKRNFGHRLTLRVVVRRDAHGMIPDNLSADGDPVPASASDRQRLF